MRSLGHNTCFSSNLDLQPQARADVEDQFVQNQQWGASPRAPPRSRGFWEVQLHQLGPVRLLRKGPEPRHGGLIYNRIHQEGWTEQEYSEVTVMAVSSWLLLKETDVLISFSLPAAVIHYPG